MSELNLNDKDVFPQACIDVFYCNKPRYFILLEKKPAQVLARLQDLAAGGPKTRMGGHILKILYWIYAATRGPNVKGGHRFQMGGPGTTGPPAGDDPDTVTLVYLYM